MANKTNKTKQMCCCLLQNRIQKVSTKFHVISKRFTVIDFPLKAQN